MRRILGVAVVALVLAAACSSDDDTAAPPTTTTVPAGPTLGPLVSGTASIVDGTYVWTDYAYDDRGPNEDGQPGGDATYSDGWRNEADLIQLQLGVDEGGVTVRAVLETLTDPTVPVVLLGFDTDGDPATGEDAFGDDWPVDGEIGAEQWVALHDPGVDVPLLVDPVEPTDVVVDPDANTIDATVPLEPDGGTWNVVAVTATVPEQAVDPTLTLHDLAFVGGEAEYRWQDDLQAEVLAGRQDVSNAIAEVDVGRLAEGGSEPADATTPGFHTYLYASDLELGEGVAQAEEGLEYRGRYQPYLVWVPDEGTAEGEPMTVFLHGLTQNHLGSVISPDGAYLGTGRPLSEEIGNLEQYARDGLDFPPHNLTVWPLARGEGLGYRGIAEQDVLDVLADATERFGPDPDRIILSGGSMGGIGAFRLAALYPDRFSVAAPIIGLATEDTVPLLPNLWNLPIRQINGAVDPLIPADGAASTTDELDRLELPYRAWMLDQRGHEAGGFVYDCVYASLPDFERVATPTNVDYVVDPAQFVSDPASGLELTYDGAYWVSGMVVADDSTLGRLSATRNDVLAEDPPSEAEHVDRRGRSGPTGGDLCGPNPDVSTGDTWQERAVERIPIDAEANEPSVSVRMTNLAAATLDLAGDGFHLAVESDQPTELTLTGLTPGTVLTYGDEEVEVDDEGSVTVTVEPGISNGRLG